MNVEIVLFDASFAGNLADFVVGVTVAGTVRRVCHEMAHPRDVRGFANEFFCGRCRAELGKRGFVCAWRFGGNALDHGLFETAKNVGDRFVNGGDARNGDRTRNNTHGIGGVTGVFGLPQLILTPPTQQVVVDDGHERHWLRVFTHEHREPSFIHRGDGQFISLRIGFGKLGDGRMRIGFHIGTGCEQRCEFAAFLRGDAGFDTL